MPHQIQRHVCSLLNGQASNIIEPECHWARFPAGTGRICNRRPNNLPNRPPNAPHPVIYSMPPLHYHWAETPCCQSSYNNLVATTPLRPATKQCQTPNSRTCYATMPLLYTTMPHRIQPHGCINFELKSVGHSQARTLQGTNRIHILRKKRTGRGRGKERERERERPRERERERALWRCAHARCADLQI